MLGCCQCNWACRKAGGWQGQWWRSCCLVLGTVNEHWACGRVSMMQTSMPLLVFTATGWGPATDLPSTFNLVQPQYIHIGIDDGHCMCNGWRREESWWKPVVQFLFCIGTSTWSHAVGAPMNLRINRLINLNVELFKYWSHMLHSPNVWTTACPIKVNRRVDRRSQCWL